MASRKWIQDNDCDTETWVLALDGAVGRFELVVTRTDAVRGQWTAYMSVGDGSIELYKAGKIPTRGAAIIYIENTARTLIADMLKNLEE